MPNWVQNELTVTGPREQVLSFAAAVIAPDHKTALRFSQLGSSPEATSASALNEWRRVQWGTKWEPEDVRVSEDSTSDRIRYEFLTADTPPVAWLRTAACSFLDLRFILRWMANEAGEWDSQTEVLSSSR